MTSQGHRWVQTLRQELAERWPPVQATRSASGDRWLLGAGGATLLGALLLWESGGAFMGFEQINGALAWIPDGFWGLVTSAGDGLVLGVLALFVARRYPHLLWTLFLGVLVAGILTHVPKELIDLPRPAGVLDPAEFRLVGPVLRAQGPPSGHSVAVFLLAGIGVYYLRQAHWRLALLTLAGFIAFSRVMVGAHWPLDVLLGAGLGLLGAWMAIHLAAWLPAGRKPWCYLGLLAFFTTAAFVLLVVFDPGYPLGRELSVLVAASVLVIVGREYWSDPPWRSRCPPRKTAGGGRSDEARASATRSPLGRDPSF